MNLTQLGKGQEQILTVMYATNSAYWNCTDFRAQVVLEEGVRYETFKVPECPDCLLENKHNSIVSQSVFSLASCLIQPYFVVEARAYFLWRINPT